MQDSFDPLTIVFVVLAVFALWKLRSVLGQRTGNERPPYDPFARKEADKADGKAPAPSTNGDNVVRLPGAAATAASRPPQGEAWEGIVSNGSPAASALTRITEVEPDFDPRQFLEGAKAAYEAIVVAFAKGDRPTLKALLSDEVFDGFDKVITERERNGERAETTFVSIAQPEITDASVDGGMAQLTLRFASKLIASTRNRAGEVVDGDPGAVVDVTDIWTFSRKLGSPDPNWRLVATESEQ